MAVNLTKKADGKLIEVAVTGKLQKEDYDHFTPIIEESIQKHNKIRIMVKMIEFQGWTACALWEDVKFDVKHFRDVERLALVGDKAWEKGMATFCKPFTTAKVRYFDIDDASAADQWIEEGLGQEASRTTSGAAASP